MIRIFKYGEISDDKILERTAMPSDVGATVSEIIENVKKNGDKALYEYAKKFDKADLKTLEVTKEEIDEAVASVEPEFLKTLEKAAENIKEFHSKQVRNGYSFKRAGGAVLGQKVIPVDRAGIYVPGGTAAYPSTVLMDTIPAKLAGVGEVIMVTPPSKNGGVDKAILTAAKVAGVDRIFKAGGAQAIAALTYGTESVPKVDKIVGPGNAYVAEAKKQVFGAVSIDMIAGPSEILVIADANSQANYVAADMLSQAEHDKMATSVLVTDSRELANAVAAELERQIPLLPRAEIARASIDNNGKIIITPDIYKAVDISNAIAPEHLELCVDDPFELLDKVRHAGSVFMGRYCPEPLGDYFAGPNHTLPTGGTARFSSPLSVDDFTKTMQFSYFTREALDEIAEDVVRFARKEGLEAHARSVAVRKGGSE